VSVLYTPNRFRRILFRKAIISGIAKHSLKIIFWGKGDAFLGGIDIVMKMKVNFSRYFTKKYFLKVRISNEY